MWCSTVLTSINILREPLRNAHSWSLESELLEIKPTNLYFSRFFRFCSVKWKTSIYFKPWPEEPGMNCPCFSPAYFMTPGIFLRLTNEREKTGHLSDPGRDRAKQRAFLSLLCGSACRTRPRGRATAGQLSPPHTMLSAWCRRRWRTFVRKPTKFLIIMKIAVAG